MSRKANGVKLYIDWAIKEGLAVMDVNVPKYLSGIDVGIFLFRVFSVSD